MIPTTRLVNVEENQNINTSKTFLINFNKESLQGKIDQLEAVKQAAYMILSTEKGAYTMYPLDYGTSLEKYIGTSYDYVTGDIGREIKESLLKDERFLDVNNFEFKKNKDNLIITFDIVTIYGEFSQEVLI